VDPYDSPQTAWVLAFPGRFKLFPADCRLSVLHCGSIGENNTAVNRIFRADAEAAEKRLHLDKPRPRNHSRFRHLFFGPWVFVVRKGSWWHSRGPPPGARFPRGGVEAPPRLCWWKSGHFTVAKRSPLPCHAERFRRSLRPRMSRSIPTPSPSPCRFRGASPIYSI